MIYLLSGLNSILFLLLCGLHIYWAFGGTWGMEAVLPTKKDGSPAFEPNKSATLTVAILLFMFAFISSGSWGLYRAWLTDDYFIFGNLIIVLLFGWRAIGDFKAIGFFKKYKGSLFAEKDTTIYSPLCVMIALVSLSIILLN